MKLYYSPGACSMAPHIVAREAGLEVTPVKVDLRTHKLEGGADFYAVNPKGYVPAIELPDGGVLTEVAAIVQYLADQAPQSGLAPAAGTPERYRFQEWLTFISSELHKGMGPLWHPVPAEQKKGIKDKLATRFSYLEKVLGGRDYLNGAAFTAADAYAFTILSWTKFLDLDLEPYPRIRGYMDRIAARQAVQATLAAEGLLKQAA
jgi:glutathione S-transferase